jgi:hypothetical protein
LIKLGNEAREEVSKRKRKPTTVTGIVESCVLLEAPGTSVLAGGTAQAHSGFLCKV